MVYLFILKCHRSLPAAELRHIAQSLKILQQLLKSLRFLRTIFRLLLLLLFPPSRLTGTFFL